MAQPQTQTSSPAVAGGGQDIGFAVGVICILTVLFLPLPAALIDAGLAFSIALSVLILMVALWIQRPIEFSAFPTILLIATLLRLSLNIATTRLILTEGHQGHDAAGDVIAGFAQFVMGGDFVIGLIVFIILITVNFLVITKGATRIAEVGARFTLDAIPGKQMAIDADLSAGLIDEAESMRRRRELEEESAFFGAMDGASKFVRGDAIAGLIITAVNIFGGIVIGVARHGMPFADAADVYVKLSVGDGLVTQIPALIVSLAAGLLVSKGGARGSAEKAVFGQLGHYPRALTVAGLVMMTLAFAPSLPFLPFAALGGALIFAAQVIPRRKAAEAAADQARADEAAQAADAEARESVAETLKVPGIELCLGKQLAGAMMQDYGELSHRVARLRRKFAKQYGFVAPEIKLTDDIALPPKSYQIKIHGSTAAAGDLRIGETLVIVGDGPLPSIPGDETREPAFGMRAIWIPELFAAALKREGFMPVDAMSVMLTHLAEVIRANLAQLFSYRDMRALLDRLEPDYRRLLDEIAPAHISHSGLQAVLRLLLAERVSIRNLPLILEAVAEAAPHNRRVEAIADHVRMRLAPQICGDLAENGAIKALRLGPRWDMAFHQALRRDAKGEVMEFAIEPALVEQFGAEASRAIREQMDKGHSFALIVGPDIRAYVRMIIDRMFPNLPVLSHLELARGVDVRTLGAVS
ncbi:MAG: flagellar biosynthesis protein FlhA [Hyphomicrobiales bacterium]|nr:flagellar biosynthesis protein FlhA [Hyphomicrobiales bacterium]